MTGIIFRFGEDEPTRVKKLNELAKGKVLGSTNGTFTLASNQALTTVTDPLFTASCLPLWVPITANATAQSPYVAARTNGEITFGHTSDNVSGRAYAYCVIA